MTADKQESSTSPTGVLSSRWLELTTRVRTRLEQVQVQATGTPLANELELLASDTRRLCDHIERLHGEARRLISEYRALTLEVASADERLASDEMDRAAIEIQREQHRKSGSALEVIKAIFMWVDTPEERIREHHQAIGGEKGAR